MNKIITFTIVAMIVFSWFITYHITEPRKNRPTNAPFIIKSNLPGTCRVSAMATPVDIKRNVLTVGCKIELRVENNGV
ncbi:hypothetical protein DPE81_24190 [Salmonella enterica subsp. enterica]|nr:hypothetical protein [Salmonella enterica subsp. enterica]EGR9487615.1 hypothetical protein [Salmonella enterica subsp. enterica]